MNSGRQPLLLARTLALVAVAFLAACGEDAFRAGNFAYVANAGGHTVSVIDTTANRVTGTIKVGRGPWHIAISRDGRRAYVANFLGHNDLSVEDTVSVIDTNLNQVIATVPVGVATSPIYITLTPDGRSAYVANLNAREVRVITTATNQLAATVKVGQDPIHIAIKPDGSRAYVVNNDGPDTLSVIDTAQHERFRPSRTTPEPAHPEALEG